MSDMFKPSMYKWLVGYVSRHALGLIVEEFDRGKHIGFYSESCGCILRTTYALPCACQLAQYDSRVIPLSKFI